jgi:hypothetical protein
MNHHLWIERLEQNRLMRSTSEVNSFEDTLALLAQNPDPSDLLNLHLILDDACEQPEVMFGLVPIARSVLEAEMRSGLQPKIAIGSRNT